MIPIPPRLTTFAAKVGVSGAVIAALGAFGVVQTVRIEGFKIWPIEHAGYKAELAASEREKAAMIAASQLAHERAVQARVAAQERYQRQAEQNHANEQEMERRVALALRDFAIRNRMRPQAAGGVSSGTIAATDDSNSDILADLSGDTLVSVEYADLQICAANTAYALGAFEWAATLNEVAE